MKKIFIFISILVAGLFFTFNQGEKACCQLDNNQPEAIVNYQACLEANGVELAEVCPQCVTPEQIQAIAQEYGCMLGMSTPYAEEPIEEEVLTKEENYIQCLNEKGAAMYGTEWCPHCRHQKELLGEYFKELKYVDCDKDKRLCRSMKIYGYPTWKLADGTEIAGGTLEQLALQAQCTEL